MAVEALYHPVCFWVVGAGPDPRGAEKLGDFCPEAGLELGSSVGGDEFGYSEAGDPAADEMPSHRDGVHGGQRNCLGPSGEAVDDSQEIGVAMGRRKWSDKVDVDVQEARVRWLEAAHGWLRVALDLGTLAVLAAPDEGTDVRVDVGPDEPR